MTSILLTASSAAAEAAGSASDGRSSVDETVFKTACFPPSVIAAKAGVHLFAARAVDEWVPAFAGTTVSQLCLQASVGRFFSAAYFLAAASIIGRTSF